MTGVRKIFSWKYLTMLIIISLLHFASIMRNTDQTIDTKFALENAKKSWLNDDEIVSEYLRNCIETDYEHWKLNKIGAIAKDRSISVMPSSAAFSYAQRYHEPVLVLRSFSIYKHNPETRPDERNWVMFGFVDAYGKIIVRPHHRADVWIL